MCNVGILNRIEIVVKLTSYNHFIYCTNRNTNKDVLHNELMYGLETNTKIFLMRLVFVKLLRSLDPRSFVD